MRFAQNPARTEPRRLEARHAGFDAEFFRVPVGGDDEAVAAPPAADPHGAAFEFGINRDFTTGEETVAIHMQNPVGCGCVHKRQTKLDCRAPPGHAELFTATCPQPHPPTLSQQKGQRLSNPQGVINSG